jgi:hypothetical protein
MRVDSARIRVDSTRMSVILTRTKVILTRPSVIFFITKKHLIRGGPYSSSIPELIDNLSKTPDVPFIVI